jgi:hypothetical protein
MNMLRKLHITALIMRYALFPPRKHNGGLSETAVNHSPSSPPGCTPVPAGDIPFYLADLNRTVSLRGEIHIFFPGCLPLAAPFLLFRLKREGYSRCRAIVTEGGLQLHAAR